MPNSSRFKRPVGTVTELDHAPPFFRIETSYRSTDGGVFPKTSGLGAVQMRSKKYASLYPVFVLKIAFPEPFENVASRFVFTNGTNRSSDGGFWVVAHRVATFAVIVMATEIGVMSPVIICSPVVVQIVLTVEESSKNPSSRNGGIRVLF